MSLLKRLESCSLERVGRMKKLVTEELAEVVQRLRNCENDFNEVADKSYTVKLDKKHGHYELTLDKIETRITRLTVQKDELVEKARVIEEVWQKQHLAQAQAKIFGSKNRVQAKDIIIFFLIMFVITILAIDLLGIGASGGDADVELEVVDGKVTHVNILNMGDGYDSVNIAVKDNNGYGVLLVGQVVEGKLSNIDIIDGGQDYVNPIVEIYPYFGNSTLWLFWIIDVTCCIFFLINFFFELKLAKSKKWYWKRNWIDFITSIPFPPVQIIASSGDLGLICMGRLLRAVRVLRALRALRVLLFVWRGMDHLSSTLDVKLLKRSLIYAVSAIFLGACFFMSLEEMESGTGFFPSLWWSFTTLVTGGYADIHDPETGLGKILTVLLVLTGMILVGVFTATLTSVLVSDDDSLKIEEIEEQTELITGINDNVKRVDDRLNKLESAIQEINESIKSNGQQSDK